MFPLLHHAVSWSFEISDEYIEALLESIPRVLRGLCVA